MKAVLVVFNAETSNNTSSMHSMKALIMHKANKATQTTQNRRRDQSTAQDITVELDASHSTPEVDGVI